MEKCKWLNHDLFKQTSENLSSKSVKAGVHLKAVFWLGILVLTQISRSHFKQSKICLLITHIYVLGCFVNFVGDFWVYLGRNSFSQRISEIYGNRKFGRFDVVLKLEFEVKNW